MDPETRHVLKRAPAVTAQSRARMTPLQMILHHREATTNIHTVRLRAHVTPAVISMRTLVARQLAPVMRGEGAEWKIAP